MATEKTRSNKAEINISSCSTMKIFNDVNTCFSSQECSLSLMRLV